MAAFWGEPWDLSGLLYFQFWDITNKKGMVYPSIPQVQTNCTLLREEVPSRWFLSFERRSRLPLNNYGLSAMGYSGTPNSNGLENQVGHQNCYMLETTIVIPFFSLIYIYIYRIISLYNIYVWYVIPIPGQTLLREQLTMPPTLLAVQQRTSRLKLRHHPVTEVSRITREWWACGSVSKPCTPGEHQNSW